MRRAVNGSSLWSQLRRQVLLVVVVATAAAALPLSVDAQDAETEITKTYEGGELIIDVITEADLDQEARVTGAEATNGTAVPRGETTVAYTPPDGFSGIDVIKIQVQSNGTTTTVEADVTVPGIQDLFSADQIAAASIVLFKVLVLAVILELALHRIFDNRWFIRLFEGRGLKSIVTVAGALVLVQTFAIDLTADLVNIFEDSTKHQADSFGKFLTALIIAGGSSTVFRLYRAIGIRPPFAAEGDSGVERRDFGRVRFIVKSGAAAGVRQSVDVFVDNELIRSMPIVQGVASTRFIPVETGDHAFSVGISPAYPGDPKWERNLSLSQLRNTAIHFDLTRQETGKF